MSLEIGIAPENGIRNLFLSEHPAKANHKIDIHETIRKMDSEDAACGKHKVCVDFGSKAPKLSVCRVLKSNEQREFEIH